MAEPMDFPFNHPNPEHAEAIFESAVQEYREGNFQTALELTEKAIAYDQIGALNSYLGLREECAKELGRDELARALELYSFAVTIARQGRHDDAQVAYREATALDPLFLWPGNNLAWMLATSKERSVRNGAEAVRVATTVCQRSNWNCWTFLETLAAAYAEAGDFERAIGWQQVSLEMAPPNHKNDSFILLRYFQDRRAYVDHGMPAAAGAGADDSISKIELLNPKTITFQRLCSLIGECHLEYEVDSDGDLWITDRIRVLTRLSQENEHVIFAAIGQSSGDVSEEACLRFVNRVNAQLRVLRAAYRDNGLVVFDVAVPLDGGTTKAAIIRMLRFFVGAVIAALEQLDTESVLGNSDDEETELSGE